MPKQAAKHKHKKQQFNEIQKITNGIQTGLKIIAAGKVIGQADTPMETKTMGNPRTAANRMIKIGAKIIAFCATNTLF